MPKLKEQLVQALAHGSSETSDFDLNTGEFVKPKQLRPAAVLIPFCQGAGGTTVLLTKRSPRLKSHPGQVAFPGGKQDPTDKDAVETALREAHEEVGLPPEHVEILGQMAPHVTVTGFKVTPVIGWIETPWATKIDQSEVAEVFTTPADMVLDPANFRIESRIWAGAPRYYFTVPSGPYYIWGASARMLRALAENMSNLG